MTTTHAGPSREVIDALAAFIAYDTPHQSSSLGMPANGLQRLRERAERFFALRRALGVQGSRTEDQIRVALERLFGAPTDTPNEVQR